MLPFTYLNLSFSYYCAEKTTSVQNVYRIPSLTVMLTNNSHLTGNDNIYCITQTLTVAKEKSHKICHFYVFCPKTSQPVTRLCYKCVLTVLYFASEVLLSEVAHVAHWLHCFYHLFCIQTYSKSVVLCKILNESINKGATMHIYFDEMCFLFSHFLHCISHSCSLEPNRWAKSLHLCNERVMIN